MPEDSTQTEYSAYYAGMRRHVRISPNDKMIRLGGPPPRTTRILLVIEAAAFILYAFTDGPDWINRLLVLSSVQFFGELKLWQPATALWLHVSARAAVLNLVALWIFGTPMERWWGSRRYVLFFLVTGVFGLLCGAITSRILGVPTALIAGCSGSVLALIVASAIVFPQHLVYLFALVPIKHGLFAWLMAGFIILGGLISQAWIEVATEIGAMACGLLFLFPPRRLLGKWLVKRTRRKYNIIEGGRKTDRFVN